MSLLLEEAEQIVEAMQNDGYDASVYEDYSGRGMFGETCVGIVTDCPTLVGFYCGKAGLDVESVPERQDSMGFDVIVY